MSYQGIREMLSNVGNEAEANDNGAVEDNCNFAWSLMDYSSIEAAYAANVERINALPDPKLRGVLQSMFDMGFISVLLALGASE